MTNHVFLRIMQLKMFGFLFVFLNCLHHCILTNNCSNVVSPVCTAFFILCFVGTPKKAIPGAALELCQLKIKQVSPEILKFSTKHKDNSFTLKYSRVTRTFCLYFMQARLGSNNFRNSSYKEKTAGTALVSRLSSRFL